MNDLLLHDKTRAQVELFLKNPSQSLLVVGPHGSGKTTVALSLVAELLGLDHQQPLSNYPYFLHITKDLGKQDISIDSVRSVIRFLHLKAPGKNGIRRAVVIEDAHSLSLEAQNALLKILEEPNNDSVFILTATTKLALLPTIVSRCRVIQIHAVSQLQAMAFYGKSQDDVSSAWQLSQGNAGLISSLISETGDHPLKIAVDKVKAFLNQSKYERLLTLDSLNKNREDYLLFLEAFAKVLAVLHHSSLNSDRQRQSSMLLDARRQIRSAIAAIENNSNVKLVSLDLLLKLAV